MVILIIFALNSKGIAWHGTCDFLFCLYLLSISYWHTPPKLGKCALFCFELLVMCGSWGNVPKSTPVGQRTTFWSPFSSSTTWVSGVQLRSLDLAASALTHGTTLHHTTAWFLKGFTSHSVHSDRSREEVHIHRI